jgi:hypothetical protein
MPLAHKLAVNCEEFALVWTLGYTYPEWVSITTLAEANNLKVPSVRVMMKRLIPRFPRFLQTRPELDVKAGVNAWRSKPD